MSRAASRECSFCHLLVPATTKSPAVHLSSGYFHYACAHKLYCDPTSTGYAASEDDFPEEQEEVEPLKEEDRNFRSAAAPLGPPLPLYNLESPPIIEIKVDLPPKKAKAVKEEQIFEAPLRQEEAKPTKWILVELKDGQKTGWTHPYLSRDSAEKKAFWLNQNGGALSYVVTEETLPLLHKAPLLPSELRKF